MARRSKEKLMVLNTMDAIYKALFLAGGLGFVTWFSIKVLNVVGTVEDPAVKLLMVGFLIIFVTHFKFPRARLTYTEWED